MAKKPSRKVFWRGRGKRKQENVGEMEPQNEREAAELRLATAAANQQNRFIDPELAQEGLVDPTLMTESDPQAKSYIEDELFPSVGFNPAGGQDSSKYAWSAATVSDLASAFDPTFEKSARHSDYIRAGFQGEGNYGADKINKRTDFKAGDILFQGRRDKDGNPLGPQTYREFDRDASGKGDWADEEGYGSHSDIITGTGTEQVLDKDGNPIIDKKTGKPMTRTYYDIQGGNVGDKLNVQKMYADELARRYAGRLTQ